MKKWTPKKLFIIVIDVFTVISLLLQAQATAVMYNKAINQWHKLPAKPLSYYVQFGFMDAFFGSSSLIRSYTTYAYDRDIYYNIAEAIVNNYSLQVMVNALFWGLIITFFMSFFVVFIKNRGKKKGEKYLLPVAVNIIYVVMRVILIYQEFIHMASQ